MNGTLLLMIVVPLFSLTITLVFTLTPLVCAGLLYLGEKKEEGLRMRLLDSRR